MFQINSASVLDMCTFFITFEAYLMKYSMANMNEHLVVHDSYHLPVLPLCSCPSMGLRQRRFRDTNLCIESAAPFLSNDQPNVLISLIWKLRMSNFGPSSIQHNLSMSSNARHADVIVIGGGVSGLVAASEVKHYDPGIEVVIQTGWLTICHEEITNDYCRFWFLRLLTLWAAGYAGRDTIKVPLSDS